MRIRSLTLYACLFVASLAPGAAPEDDDAVPEGVADAAFARYVDLDLIRKAVVDRDAPLLCDVALQLAEGERVLLRPHKGLPADRLFRLAMATATDKRDLKTLDRLERAAKALKRDELAKLLPAAKLLAGKARRLDAGLMVAADTMSVESLLMYRSFLEQINVAASLNDRERLGRMERGIAALPDLADAQRAALRARVAEARKSLADREDDEGDDLLRRLAASSRSGNRAVKK